MSTEFFINRWDGSGDCYCVHCREDFKAATGFDLPRAKDSQDAARRAYLVWRQKKLMSLLDRWNTEIRVFNAEASMIPNNGGGALSPIDAIETSRRTPMLVADRQARRGLAAPWLMGKTAKEYRATMEGKPVIGLFGVGHRRALSVEGQREQQRGDSHLGAGCNRERNAPVV